MKIDAYSANGAGRSLLLSRGAQQILRGGVFPGEVRIAEVVASVDQNGRPSLQLLGAVATLKVDGDEVAIINSDLSMLWQYEFTRDQLVAMTQRGLLEKGLGEQPFNGLVGSVVELPVPTQLSMLSLNGTDYLFACREPFRAPPLITVDNCGYDLAPFFEPVAEVNPLQARERLDLERQAGFTGVDLLFDDEHELGGTLSADQPVQQVCADLVDEALRLVHPNGDGGQVAPAAEPVSPRPSSWTSGSAPPRRSATFSTSPWPKASTSGRRPRSVVPASNATSATARPRLPSGRRRPGRSPNAAGPPRGWATPRARTPGRPTTTPRRPRSSPNWNCETAR